MIDLIMFLTGFAIGYFLKDRKIKKTDIKNVKYFTKR